MRSAVITTCLVDQLASSMADADQEGFVLAAAGCMQSL